MSITIKKILKNIGAKFEKFKILSLVGGVPEKLKLRFLTKCAYIFYSLFK